VRQNDTEAGELLQSQGESSITESRCTEEFALNAVIPDPDVIGQWYVIHYDKSVYPGIIQDIDNASAEVNCMCSIGNNRFFWGLVEGVNCLQI
jgi:hypothetical protein